MSRAHSQWIAVKRKQRRVLRSNCSSSSSFRRLGLEQLEERCALAAESISSHDVLLCDDLPAEDPSWIAAELDSSKTPPYPLADSLLLHSNPGASKVIYLDFDGHTTTGTLWNSAYGTPIVTPAYSFEGDASFSAAELAFIQRIWERVSEDFIPFDVDVTTQDPGVEALRNTGGGDTQWGIRVVIGPENWYPSSAGGVAYVGSFVWSTDTPCFVFNTSETGVAEAVSHEAGHTLGLNHDGTSTLGYYEGHGSGETGWAPIMGVGYYQQLVQWSKGEYPGANNTENDLSIITTQNGFGYRVDDHGGSIGSSSALSIEGTNVFAEGIIERTTDVDYFVFSTTGGSVNLNIDPFYRSPNLDILATLYDSAGTPIATSNDVGRLAANFDLELTGGTYYVSVAGIGKDAAGSDYGYSDYASLGYFTITGTIVDAVPLSDLAGTVFDVNPNHLLTAGGLTSANFVVRNLGNMAAGAFDIKFYLSDDNLIDPGADLLLTLDAADPNYDPLEPSAYHLVSGLAPLGTHSDAISLAVPVSDPFSTDGNYYLGMVVDADNDVTDEFDETNNLNRGLGLDTDSVDYFDNVAAFPFFEDWEAGTAFDPWWEVNPGVEGRIQITSDNSPYQGTYHVTLDDTTDASALSLNQLILHINLAGQSSVRLQFANREFGDEDHAQDSVDISVDGGANWHQIVPLTGANSTSGYSQRMYLLDSLGLTYSSDTLIRFQQYDDYPISTDGMAFDNIRVDTAPILTEFFLEELNENPGWTAQGEWAFGQPAGQGGLDHGNPDPTSGATGPNVYGVDLIGDYDLIIGGPHYLTTSAIDTTGYTNVTLAFDRWLNTDYPSFVFATIDVSNNETDWTNVFTNPGAEIADSAWHQEQYDISSVADDQETVYIRWGYRIESGAYAYSGWNIDDIRLLGTPSSPPVTPGDYNDDGTVDTADYVLYRKYENTDTPLPNDLIGGTIGQGQFDQWKAHFGQSTPDPRSTLKNDFASLSASAAPESPEGARVESRPAIRRAANDLRVPLVVEASSTISFVRPAMARSRVSLATYADHDAALVAWLESRGSASSSYMQVGDIGLIDDDPGERLLELFLESIDAVPKKFRIGIA